MKRKPLPFPILGVIIFGIYLIVNRLIELPGWVVYPAFILELAFIFIGGIVGRKMRKTES